MAPNVMTISLLPGTILSASRAIPITVSSASSNSDTRFSKSDVPSYQPWHDMANCSGISGVTVTSNPDEVACMSYRMVWNVVASPI